MGAVHARLQTRQNQTQEAESSSLAPANSAALEPAHREYPVLQLQRAIGNQAVQRMLQTGVEGREAGLASSASLRIGHEVTRLPTNTRAVGAIQTKLQISEPGDEYEREADRIAEQVMRVPEPELQRNSDCNGGRPSCQTEQQGQKQALLQSKQTGSSGLGEGTSLPLVYEVLRSPGQPLDLVTRTFMESRFGHDFSRVRVHTDERAANSAQALNARAYAVGHDMAFGTGQYTPQTSEGRRLLAHELTHTLQQGESFIRLQRAPDAKDDLQKQFEITIERGDKDWTENEVRVLQASLARLGPKNKAIVKGYKFVRWSSPQNRDKKDSTYIRPTQTRQENCLQEYAPAQGIFKITAYDSCFSDPEARPGTDTTFGIDTGQFRLLHEVGHAAQFAEHRQAFAATEAAVKARNEGRGRLGKPKGQKAQQTDLKQLEDAVKAANDALGVADNRTFNQFKKLMKGKRIISPGSESTEDPAIPNMAVAGHLGDAST